MKMYTTPRHAQSRMNINKSTKGETIEQKIERIVNNKEPIKDGAPLLYTERGEGIKASTNIRTDRFEIAVEASDKIAKSYKARREERGLTAKDKSRKPIEKDDKVESTQGKEGTSTQQS